MLLKDSREITIDRGRNFFNSLKDSVYIVGTNKYGSYIKKWLDENNIEVKSFINDFFGDENFLEIPVIKFSNVGPNESIINCAEARFIDIYNKISLIKPKQQIDYLSLQLAFPHNLPAFDYTNYTDTILNDRDKYETLYNQLEDEKSKETLEKVTSFRLNRNIFDLKEFELRIQEQYFEPFVKLKESPAFIDGGGFDGDTSVKFAALYPNYHSIHLFEPNFNMLDTAKKNLKSFSNIHYYLKGLWSSTTTFNFDNSLGSASKITEQGKIVIEAISLDETINEKIDFIKLDIEGAECEALKGAKNLIQKYKPALAVCVYHDQRDFIRIPELVTSLRSDYKIYLRHYTQGIFETVMYFI
jgi:FkbM family methyltransferase